MPVLVYVSEVIGTGSYGVVALATEFDTDTRHRRRVAVKVFRVHADILTGDTLREMVFARVLNTKRHSNLMCDSRLHVFTDRQLRAVSLQLDIDYEVLPMCVVMPIMDGDLSQFVCNTEGRRLNLVQVMSIVRQVLEGVAFLHSMGVVHQDLKPANMLFRWVGTSSSGDMHIRLCDFGLSTLMPAMVRQEFTSSELVNSEWWRSPESLKTPALHSFACDIWAVGISMVMLTFNHHLFSSKEIRRCAACRQQRREEKKKKECPDHTCEAIIERLLGGSPDAWIHTDDFERRCGSPLLAKLLRNMLCVLPERRFTASALLSMMNDKGGETGVADDRRQCVVDTVAMRSACRGPVQNPSLMLKMSTGYDHNMSSLIMTFLQRWVQCVRSMTGMCDVFAAPVSLWSALFSGLELAREYAMLKCQKCTMTDIVCGYALSSLFLFNSVHVDFLKDLGYSNTHAVSMVQTCGHFLLRPSTFHMLFQREFRAFRRRLGSTHRCGVHPEIIFNLLLTNCVPASVLKFAAADVAVECLRPTGCWRERPLSQGVMQSLRVVFSGSSSDGASSSSSSK